MPTSERFERGGHGQTLSTKERVARRARHVKQTSSTMTLSRTDNETKAPNHAHQSLFTKKKRQKQNKNKKTAQAFACNLCPSLLVKPYPEYCCRYRVLYTYTKNTKTNPNPYQNQRLKTHNNNNKNAFRYKGNGQRVPGTWCYFNLVLLLILPTMYRLIPP